MALSEVLIYSSPANTPFNTAQQAWLTPNGIIWPTEQTSGAHMIVRAIDLNTDTVLAEFDLLTQGVRPMAVNPTTDAFLARAAGGAPDQFYWVFTTAGVVKKYNITLQVETVGRFGAVDSNGVWWVTTTVPSSKLVSLTNFVDGTPVGTALATQFTHAPIEGTSTRGVAYLGNAGAIAGRLYFRPFTSTTALNVITPGTTRGIGWINIATGAVTLIYSAVGRYQPTGIVDPAGFIYTMDVDFAFPSNHVAIKKLDQDGAVVASAAVSFSLRDLVAMVVDDDGNVWVDMNSGTSRHISVYDGTSLALIDIVVVATDHGLLWDYGYASNSVLTQDSTGTASGGTGEFNIFEIVGPVAPPTVTEQPRIFVTT